MKKITLIGFALLSMMLFSCAQTQSTITTIILVRHAEKADDGTKDPGLTEEGQARAAELARVMKETKIDAIYSTPYKRTQNTVQPLANAKGLKLISYEPMKAEEMDKLLAERKGGTIIISGHSNTTPWVANYFLGSEVYADFKDSDYDNVIILSIIEKGNAKATLINYGKSTQ